MASGDVQCEENSTVPKGSGHNEGLAKKCRGGTGVVVVGGTVKKGRFKNTLDTGRRLTLQMVCCYNPNRCPTLVHHHRCQP